MDRLTLAAVLAVPLGAQETDVEKEVEEAVAAERSVESDAHTAPSVTAEEVASDDDEVADKDDDDTYHVILLCPCAAQGARCVRKCCHSHSVLAVDARGDTSCVHDHQEQQQEQPRQDVATARDYNRARTAEAAREWWPSQHRHPDQQHSGQISPQNSTKSCPFFINYFFVTN